MNKIKKLINELKFYHYPTNKDKIIYRCSLTFVLTSKNAAKRFIVEGKD